MGGAPASRPTTAPPDPDRLDRPWLAGYPPGVPPSYAYPRVPLTRFIDDAARDFPETVATAFHGAELTYAELAELADRFAGALAGAGVRPGTPVAVRLDPSPALPATVFAILRLGAVIVPLPGDLRGDVLATRLAEGGCEVAVVEATWLDALNEVRGDLDALRTVIATGPDEWLPFLRARWLRLTGRRSGAYRRTAGGDGAARWSDLVDDAEPLEEQGAFGPAHPALRAVTPEGRWTTLSHGHLLAATFQARLWVPDVQAGKERVLVAEPTETVQRLVCGLLAPVLAAASLHLVRHGDPEDAGEAIEDGRTTLLTASPDLFGALAAAGDRIDLSSLRVGFVEGTIDEETAQRLEERTGARIRSTYGRSDAPFTHASPVYGRARRGEVGLPVTDTVAIVVDDADQPVDPGQPGRMLVAGPQVAGDGRWTSTGQRAVMSEEGSFRLVTVDGT